MNPKPSGGILATALSITTAAVHDEYTARGEIENRNKELRRELVADRLSVHRALANFFRCSCTRRR